jgi:hypothetical protein
VLVNHVLRAITGAHVGVNVSSLWMAVSIRNAIALRESSQHTLEQRCWMNIHVTDNIDRYGL